MCENEYLWSKGLKAFAEDNINVAKMMISLWLSRKHCKKEKMLVTNISSFSPSVFQSLL